MTQTSPFHLQWKGRRGLLMRALEHVTGLRRLDTLYRRHISDQQGLDFVRTTLDILGIKYRVDGSGLSNIPPTGPLVVIANHPFGGAEGLALMEALLKVRPDTRILANQLLNALPGLKDLFIGVDILSETTREERKTANKKAVAEATQWVGHGGLLLVFPAGEVASWDWKTGVLREAAWRHTAGQILKDSKASVLPVYVEGRNSWLFYTLGMLHPILRTARLVRELINKKGQTIVLKPGSIVPAQTFRNLPAGSPLTNALRMRTLLLASDPAAYDANTAHVDIASANGKPIVDPVELGRLKQDIQKLDDSCRLISKGNYEVWCAEPRKLPNILQEIGRLREVTFRAVGEGTGYETDIDPFDSHYLHLFVWNKERCEIVGAYRLGQIDKLIGRHGVNGLYTRSLFQYDQRFLQKLGPCLEMGRSFVRPEYQKSLMALQLLWKGIAAWIVKNPRYRVLFGPVSISRDYRELSRYLMAMSLEENNFNKELADLVKPSQPLPTVKNLPWSREMLAGLGDIEQLSSLVQVLEKDRGVPVLMRQYLKLNGSFVGFNVDREFNDALDGLIIVDLLKSDRKAVTRYLGEEGYDILQAYHAKAEYVPTSCGEAKLPEQHQNHPVL